jgi:hypothetical protein
MSPKPPRRSPEQYPWTVPDRETAARRMRAELGEWRSVLRDDVDFGLLFLGELLRDFRHTRSSITAVAVTATFRRSLEFLDGVELLLAAGSVAAAAGAARSYLETAVLMLHLLSVNDERVATAYLLLPVKRTIWSEEERAKSNVAGSRPTIEARSKIEEAFDAVAEMRLQREAMRELDRLRQEHGEGARWFEAFGGPRTLQTLVRRLNIPGLEVLFDAYYGGWSRMVHSEDALQTFREITDERRLFRPLRGPDARDWQPVAPFCNTVFVVSIARMLAYYGVDGRIGPDWWWQMQDNLPKD